MMRAIRWSDSDRGFGPFTFSWSGPKGYRSFAVILKSWGSGDDDAGPASLRISVPWFTFILALPPVLRPWRRKVYPESWDAATVARLGRNWYWDVEVREYGFSYSDGFLMVHYGISPGDSTRDQTWCKHLPWTQWRHVRHSLYGLKGEEFYTEHEWQASLRAARSERYEIMRRWEELCPVVRFKIKDFDGEEIIATTKIEEREWRFGTGWFKWLSQFRQSKVRRSLYIDFSNETGPEKGSWKGGTMGTGIDMLPGELHEEAFRRYCDQEHRSKYRKYKVTFVERSEG